MGEVWPSFCITNVFNFSTHPNSADRVERLNRDEPRASNVENILIFVTDLQVEPRYVVQACSDLRVHHHDSQLAVAKQSVENLEDLKVVFYS